MKIRFALVSLSVLSSASFVIAPSAIAKPRTVERPAADVARDAARKPKEMVTFARIARGKVVADILPGGGYFTRVFANVVGSRGKVLAMVPPQMNDADPDGVKAMAALAADKRYGMIKVIASIGDVAPGTLDVAWTAQNYHDLNLFLPPEGIAQFNAGVFAALKPGGTYVIVDHAARAGSGTSTTDTLHRIDPATVKTQVIAAGFKFDGESAVLSNPADDHSKPVFDEAIRGRTDQFVYRFRKP